MSDEQLFTYLVESSLGSKRVLESAYEESQKSGTSFSKTLIERGVFSADELRRAVAHMLGIPFVRLSARDISPSVMQMIPEPVAREHGVMAYASSDEGIEVAMLDIDDLPHVNISLNSNSSAKSSRVLPRLTDSGSMREVNHHYQRHLRERFGDGIAREAALIVEPSSVDSGGLLEAAQQVPAAKLVDMLLRHAQMSGASDIHLQKKENGLMVRYRIHGRLRDTMLLPQQASAGIMLRLKLLSQTPLTTMVPREGRFELSSEYGRATVSLSSITTAVGERVVLHLVPDLHGRDGYSLQALGFSGGSLEVVHAILKQHSGLVLVAGQKGAGKTTTLYTLADLLSAGDRNVVVVEESHECQLKGVSQVKTNIDLGLNLAAALRAALRQDPDIIVLSSIPNAEVAEVALRAANRGVLVVAGFEAPDIVSALSSLCDLVGDLLVSATFRGGVGVAQLKRLCEAHDTRALSRTDLEELGDTVDPVRVLATLKEHGVVDVRMSWKELQFGDATPCTECDAGYRGRTGVQQGLLSSHTFIQSLRAGASHEALLLQARAEGMLTLEEDALCKAVQNFTSVAEVLRMVQRSS